MMTEAEWLACEDPDRMVKVLRGRAGERKTRLFGCAGCRSVWHLLSDGRCREAVEAAEEYADDPTGKAELASARRAVRKALDDAEKAYEAAWGSPETPRACRAAYAARTAWNCCRGALRLNFPWAIHDAVRLGTRAKYMVVRLAGYESARASLLREVFGNPFRPATLDAAWRTPDVLALARAAYEQRVLPAGTLEAARLALLADALEEAGCGNDILGHLRDPGPHVRGCWVVDLVLGKG